MHPRSKSANCPHTELIKDIVTSSNIKMKFSPSGNPMTCLKITRMRRRSFILTISTHRTNRFNFFGIHNYLIVSMIPEKTAIIKTRS